MNSLEDLTAGSNNIALGFLAGANITTGSGNIDIDNAGLATDTNIIRIGSGQTQTFIAGVINGNGAGLTGLTTATIANYVHSVLHHHAGRHDDKHFSRHYQQC